MGKLIRCITSDGLVMATAIDSTDIVSVAEQYHKTSAVVTAALGRLLTATSMMGDMLGLGVGMAAMSAMAPQVGEMMKGFMVQPQGAADVKMENSKTENSESAGVCSHCGKPLVPNAKFCMECGHPLTRKCPNCGSDVSPEGKFCMECGTKR